MRSKTALGARDLSLLRGSLEIIDGHILVEAARRLGLESLDYIIADDLSDLEVRTLRKPDLHHDIKRRAEALLDRPIAAGAQFELCSASAVRT